MREKPSAPDIAIEAVDLGIQYRRYHRKALRLKDSVLSLFRANRFETFWALRRVNLTVRKGESVGIIGPNGSGKSTLLKAIAGVLWPAEGTLRSQGRIAPLIELGGGFNPQLTGRENIYLNGAIMGVPRAVMEEKIDSIIEFADIGDFIDAPLLTYSSGMRARLAFAVSTDIDPEILLLDEVFAVGDAAFQEKAAARMEHFFHSERSVITVSHSLDIIERLCQRAVFIQAGEVQADGAPKEVLAEYRDSVKRKLSVTKPAKSSEAKAKLA